MALTRNFKETILARVQRDRKFRNALLKEGIETLLSGDVGTGKAILRDDIKASVGFEKLGTETGSSPKSLIRMFGPSGNPQARNLFAVISHLQRDAGLILHVTARSQCTAAWPSLLLRATTAVALRVPSRSSGRRNLNFTARESDVWQGSDPTMQSSTNRPT